MFADPKYTAKGHPCWGGGRPRTAIPEKEELIELGKDLVSWASKPQEEGEPLRLRFCEWYTERGFIMTQWEGFRDKPEFAWYYQQARTLLARKYVDGTVHQSIAHRYMRMYDPELRREEDIDLDAAEERKARALKSESKAAEQARQEVLDEIQRHKRALA
jgi:hypothetical protein